MNETQDILNFRVSVEAPNHTNSILVWLETASERFSYVGADIDHKYALVVDTDYRLQPTQVLAVSDTEDPAERRVIELKAMQEVIELQVKAMQPEEDKTNGKTNSRRKS